MVLLHGGVEDSALTWRCQQGIFQGVVAANVGFFSSAVNEDLRQSLHRLPDLGLQIIDGNVETNRVVPKR